MKRTVLSYVCLAMHKFVLSQYSVERQRCQLWFESAILM